MDSAARKKVNQQRYYERHKAEIAANRKRAREADPEALREYFRVYRSQHREHLIALQRKHRAENPERKKQSDARYRQNNPAACRESRRKYVNKRRKNDPAYDLQSRLRSSLNQGLRIASAKKSDRLMNLVGCSGAELKTYIESKFTSGMTWDNRSKWHVDHIRPVSSFDLTDPAQQRACFHYTNLQPLWAADNLRKKDKFIGSCGLPAVHESTT